VLESPGSIFFVTSLSVKSVFATVRNLSKSFFLDKMFGFCPAPHC
jgi:hypothetical protein